MSHPIVHFELWSPNPETASKFYSSVFGWRINYTPALSYWLIDTGATMGAGGSAGGINGGMFKPEQGPLPALLTFYVGVDDIGAYIRKAVEAGAKVLVPESEIPGVGWSAIVLDPDQRAIGLFKPLPMPPTPRPSSASAARKRPAKKARPAAAAGKAPAKKPRAAAAKQQPAKKK